MDPIDEVSYWTRENWLQLRAVKFLLLMLVLIQGWDKIVLPILRVAGLTEA